MGNTIGSEQAGLWLDLTDGATTVLLSTLVLAGSDLAQNEWERSLVAWLAEHDQTMLGAGMAGFDLDEVAFTPEEFEAQRAFLLRCIDAARGRHRFAALGYDPPFVRKDLAALRALLERYEPAFVNAGRSWTFRLGAPPLAARCPTHDALCHAGGCLLCHDAAYRDDA
jgi:hypothetical protein